MPKPEFQANITDLSHDGRGVGNHNGKTILINGALPGEFINFTYLKRHSKYDEGLTTSVVQASPHRVVPVCPHYEICGGCNLQHLEHTKQIEFKTKTLLEQLQHFGTVTPEKLLPPLMAEPYHYRCRARLTVKYVAKKNKLLIGFHEKNGRYVADITNCPILHANISDKIIALQALVTSLSINQQVAQIEVAVSDDTTALIIRHLAAFTAQDYANLVAFSNAHNCQIYLQPHGPDSITYLGDKPELNCTKQIPLQYSLPKHDVTLTFLPTDFTQINTGINRQMVDLALELLNPQPQDKILDLFCGLGNFTIPLAKYCNKVVGVEGSNQMVVRGEHNAKNNSISNAEFYCADLTKQLPNAPWAQQTYDKILLDPPRTGALEIIQQLPQFAAKKILYISCNPATLARDSKALLAQGYKLAVAGVIDMFPHTSHVETITLWE